MWPTRETAFRDLRLLDHGVAAMEPGPEDPGDRSARKVALTSGFVAAFERWPTTCCTRILYSVLKGQYLLVNELPSALSSRAHHCTARTISHEPRTCAG